MESLNYTEINLFKGTSIVEYSETLLDRAKQEIISTPKSIIENDEFFAESLYDKYSLQNLVINKNDRKVEHLGIGSIQVKDDFEGYYDQPVKIFLVSYYFTGSSELFSLQPSIISLNHYSGNFLLSSLYNRIGYVFNIKDHIELDATYFEGLISQVFKRLFDTIPNVTQNVIQLNNSLKSTINDMVDKRLNDLNKVESFLDKLNSSKS